MLNLLYKWKRWSVVMLLYPTRKAVFNIEINDDQLEFTGVVDGLQHKFEADRT